VLSYAQRGQDCGTSRLVDGISLMTSGSDMHVLLTGDLGLSKFDQPFILGHECAGIVAKGTSCHDLQIQAQANE
jgi:threonine dehydrogenase-like Zn-dependent dehydrogenase